MNEDKLKAEMLYNKILKQIYNFDCKNLECKICPLREICNVIPADNNLDD